MDALLLTVVGGVMVATLVGLARLAFKDPPFYRSLSWYLFVGAAWGTSLYSAYAFGHFAGANGGPEAFRPFLVIYLFVAFSFGLIILLMISYSAEDRAKKRNGDLN